MTNTLKLGQIITTEQHRDAIHIAVAPVIAAIQLKPGDHVALLPNGKAMKGPDCHSIGIVDPFLKAQVKPGETFWLFLYPNSISSLRHNWTHPAFETYSERIELQEDKDSWRIPKVVEIATVIRQAMIAERMREGNKSGYFTETKILADLLEDNNYPNQKHLQTLHRGYPFETLEQIICYILGGDLQDSVKWLEEFAEECRITYFQLMRAAEDYVEHGEYFWLSFDTPYYAYTNKEAFWKHYKIVTESKTEKSGVFFQCSC